MRILFFYLFDLESYRGGLPELGWSKLMSYSGSMVYLAFFTRDASFSAYNFLLLALQRQNRSVTVSTGRILRGVFFSTEI